ncbi:2'-5' RNA ligase family protein [Hydrocarboniphaga sp.]|uniref:2'-5' RNA ligase family protein n=1 Tax=Hydrocarboniphaga sp. TaxID=2033016 RepID=UPI00260441AF|nr:2'-5' RNA ligase family protein [Hydrocarboniphaga sp.]
MNRAHPSAQASLFGEPETATDRLFFAIFPATDAAAQAAALACDLRSRHRLGGQPLASDRLHVTLNHLGDYVGVPRDLVAAATKAGGAVAASSFDVCFDRVASFASARAVVLQGGEGLAALIAFQQALVLEMTKAGLGRKAEKNFTPHMTLLYDKSPFAEQPIEPVSWTVQEFVLVHSLLGQTRHIALARWRLQG